MIAATTDDGLFTYRLMQRVPTGNSYVLRLMAVCFVGTHIPLVAACLYFLIVAPGGIGAHLADLLMLLCATLLGTAFTLVSVRFALAPIMRSSEALRRYVEDRTLPALPLHYADEAGVLMSSVQTVTERLEMALRQQEMLAATDPLTGIANRRVLFDRSVGLLNEARRGGRPLSIVVLDIDHFKSVNDSFGHAAGDAVIRAVADVVSAHAGTGVAARLGGEEFAILLPGTSAERAAQHSETIRRAVAALEIPQCPGREISVSLGVAQADPDVEPTIHLALERADHALYRAKEAGRDRVDVAD